MSSKKTSKSDFAGNYEGPLYAPHPDLTMKTKTDDNAVKHLEWVTKPEDAVTYDDAFWVKEQRWGTFTSVGSDDLNILTSLSLEQCVNATRWYLKAKQDGFTDDAPTYDSFVGGKL